MTTFANIARLFNYPEGKYHSTVEELIHTLKPYGENTVNEFLPVAEHFSNNTVAGLQEYYIRTFDVNATCYLDIGYVLFGEESKRGQFLLHMKSEQLKAGNDCGTEFPDHLPNILTLLPKIEDDAFREELVVSILIPGLKLMIENFKSNDNIYLNLIQVLVSILENDFRDSAFEPFNLKNNESKCADAYSCGIDFSAMKNKHY